MKRYMKILSAFLLSTILISGCETVKISGIENGNVEGRTNAQTSLILPQEEAQVPPETGQISAPTETETVAQEIIVENTETTTETITETPQETIPTVPEDTQSNNEENALPGGGVYIEEGEEIQEVTEDNKNESYFKIHFFDVGQGDSILVECDGEYMLVDAGDNDKGTYVQNYLQNAGVSKLKYVVGTHPHADHIGGLDVILYKFDCENIFMSPSQLDTNTYRDVIDVINNKGYTYRTPELFETFNVGSSKVEVIGPVVTSEDLNDESICLKITYGNTKYLLMGDAEEISEQGILNAGVDVQAQVIKLGHHGSSSSSSPSFIEGVNPQYAIISCGEINDYGHPHVETMRTLIERNIQCYRTDKQGNFVLTSDGTSIYFDKAPTEDYSAGINETQTNEEKTYVLNVKSKKFHNPDCEGVLKMSDKNKQEQHTTRDALINDGYSPCGICKP